MIRKGSWDVPPIFSFLKEKGKIPEEEMLRSFNNGIGMILAVRPKELEDVLGRLRSLGEKAFIIGDVLKAEQDQPAIEYI